MIEVLLKLELILPSPPLTFSGLRLGYSLIGGFGVRRSVQCECCTGDDQFVVSLGKQLIRLCRSRELESMG